MASSWGDKMADYGRPFAERRAAVIDRIPPLKTTLNDAERQLAPMSRVSQHLAANIDPVLADWSRAARAEIRSLAELGQLRFQLYRLGAMRGITWRHPKALVWRLRWAALVTVLFIWRIRWLILSVIALIIGVWLIAQLVAFLMRVGPAIIDWLSEVLLNLMGSMP